MELLKYSKMQWAVKEALGENTRSAEQSTTHFEEGTLHGRNFINLLETEQSTHVLENLHQRFIVHVVPSICKGTLCMNFSHVMHTDLL